MAMIHACAFVLATMLLSFFLPTYARTLPLSSHTFSFQLHLQRPTSDLHNPTCIQQPLTPYLFSAQPLLFHPDNQSSLPHVHAGRADGLYLADPAGSMKVRYVFFTATLEKDQGGEIARVDDKQGSLVLMGSIGSGAVAIVGGTQSFAFARGQAKVSTAPGGSSEELVIFFDVELQCEAEVAFL